MNRIVRADDVRTLAAWAELSHQRGFYASPPWLNYAQGMCHATHRYRVFLRGDRPVAALSSHFCTQERSPGYLPTITTPQAPCVGQVVTLGGLRGYLSEVLRATDTPGDGERALGDLMRDALEEQPERPHWWWPYLTDADLGAAVRAARHAFGRPLGVHLIGMDCATDLQGEELNDHIASLQPTQRRTNFRAERKRFAAAGLQVRPVLLHDSLHRLGPLLANVQQKYGQTQTAEEMTAALARHAALMGEHAAVFGVFESDDLLAFSLCYGWGDMLTVRAVGFDYARLKGLDEYALVAIHAPLEHSYRQGLRHLHLGMDCYEAKVRRGIPMRPLWALSSWEGASSQAIAAKARELAGELPHREATLFVEHVQDSLCNVDPPLI